MRPQPQFEKLLEVSKLKRGDRVKLISGETVEFQAMKQKNFTGLMNNKLYNIPINLFDSLLEKAAVDNKTDEIGTLKSGDLFYIVKKESAVVFIFNFIRGNEIHAINPVNNGNIRMNVSMFAGKISSLTGNK